MTDESQTANRCGVFRDGSPLTFVGREALAAVVAFFRPVTDAWTRIRGSVKEAEIGTGGGKHE
jgi:hypothetical protein